MIIRFFESDYGYGDEQKASGVERRQDWWK
jgi:hypothetical protein